MSSTGTNTSYEFSFDTEDSSASINGGFTMYTGASPNDALALAIFQALNGVPWPTGVTKAVTVIKVTDTMVSSTPDLTTNPPSFT